MFSGPSQNVKDAKQSIEVCVIILLVEADHPVASYGYCETSALFQTLQPPSS